MDNTNTLKLYWNGIKGTDGRLQKASFHAGTLMNFPAGTITIYAKTYTGFSAEVSKVFTVNNDRTA
jgi:hypothetical protein